MAIHVHVHVYGLFYIQLHVHVHVHVHRSITDFFNRQAPATRSHHEPAL